MYMNKVLIINTGGTIGMAHTPNGYTPVPGYFRSELERIQELEHENMPKWDMIEMDPILDSSNITVNEWNKIGEVIRDNYETYCGFVIIHGTVIVVCSQCPQGTVSLGTYETSSGLKNAGAVCGSDLTTEAAVTKLYYLFSCGYSTEEVKQYMETDIAGELTKQV